MWDGKEGVCVCGEGGWSYLRSKDVVCNVLLIVSKTADEKGTGLQPCMRSGGGMGRRRGVGVGGGAICAPKTLFNCNVLLIVSKTTDEKGTGL